MRVLGVVLLLAACGSKPPDASREVTGSLTLDGKALAITKCLTGRAATTYVELVTPAGKLRFEDAQLFWSTDPAAVSRGAPLDCEKLDRSWGGGQRLDGTAYFRGTLDFRCKGDLGALVGNVTADCGNITAEERKALDEGRKRKQDELKGAAPAEDSQGSAGDVPSKPE